MTQSKREPFAKAVALRYSDSGGQTYGVEVLGFKLAGNFNETGAMLRAMGINARVDEEMRKAVEEFRERAAKIQQEQKHGVMARRIRDAFNKGSSLGREARDQEVAELKAKIAGLEGRIQGMLESRELGKGE